MKKIIKYTLATLAFTAANNANAQNLNSGYFLDGFAYSHEINPAKDYDRKVYFSVPVLPGNLNAGLRGNLHLTDILHKNPNGNGLTTYLNPNISYADAMKGFSTRNTLMSDLRFDLVSVGFHTKNAFHTIGIGIRSTEGADIPYTFFDVTKQLENKNYSISDLNVQMMAWAELSYGYSRNINEAWRIGGKAKILLGGAYASMKMDQLNLDLTGVDKWTVTAHANVEAGVKGLTWGEKEIKEYTKAYRKKHPGTPATYEQINFDNIDVKNTGLNGGGIAFDLGAEWDMGKQGILEGMKLSASLLDLGFIKWNKVALAHNNGEDFVFDGFHHIKVENGPGVPFDEQADDLGDRFSNLYSLKDGGTTSKTKGIGATLNIGCEYALPSYNKLKFGLLSTTRIHGKYTWNEERISANVSPLKWLEGGINLGVGTLGASFGWIVNIHPRGFNFFIGGDNVMGKLSKQGIPLKSKSNIAMGINFPIGKSNK